MLRIGKEETTGRGLEIKMTFIRNGAVTPVCRINCLERTCLQEYLLHDSSSVIGFSTERIERYLQNIKEVYSYFKSIARRIVITECCECCHEHSTVLRPQNILRFVIQPITRLGEIRKNDNLSRAFSAKYS